MSPPAHVPERPARVLIVDDGVHDRRLLEVMLNSEGFELLSAASGEEALTIIVEHPPDLILLDLTMRGMDGCQVASRLKADTATRSIPIIMVTARDDREARLRGLHAGAEDFLSKPVDRAELCVRVRNLLRIRSYGERAENYSQILEGEVVERTAELIERTEALDALRRQYALILDSIADGVYGTDLGGRVTLQNRGAAEMLGPGTGIGTIAHAKLHHSRADGSPYPEVDCPIHMTLLDGIVRRVTDEVFWRSDGRPFSVEYLAAPMRDAAGAIVGVVVSLRDTTQWKEAERQRRASDEQYRLLFDRNPHPMYVCDAETLAFLAVNEAAVDHYGHARARFLEMSIKDICTPEEIDGLLRGMKRVAPDHASSDVLGVFKHLTSGGAVIDMDIAASRLMFQGWPAVLCLAVDVTEKKSLAAQLQQSQKMESIGRLAGGVAHDFNNLLGVILGYGDILLRKVQDESVRERLTQIVKAAERAAGLTRQLLAFSRKQVLQPRILDLNDLVVGMETMLRRMIGEDMQLVTILRGRGHVRADPGQIEQVLMNLVVNARDAMPTGGVLTIETANAGVEESCGGGVDDLGSRPCLTIAVSDTGVGMTLDVQRQIFEPFFTTKGLTEGTGLGLATSDGIIKQSGGHIAVSSKLGEGSTFKVYLPKVDDGVHAELGVVAAVLCPRGTETILLVEDEPGIRELTREILEAEGYAVIEAGSGDGAFKCAGMHAGPIDLLLTDVVMPRMGGRELAESLAALRPAMQVLFMSGYTDDAVVRHGVLSADTAFIQKPFSPDSLLAKVREVLELRDKPTAH